MIAVGFLLCVAGGYFAYPMLVWTARRIWTHGLVGFWMAEAARRQLAAPRRSVDHTPLPADPPDPHKLHELREGINRAVTRLTADLMNLDERIAAALITEPVVSVEVNDLMQCRRDLHAKLEQYRCTLRDVECSIKEAEALQEQFDCTDEATGPRNVNWRIVVYHDDRDCYRCYRFDDGTPQLIGATNFRVEAERLVQCDRQRVLDDPLATETEQTLVLAAF